MFVRIICLLTVAVSLSNPALALSGAEIASQGNGKGAPACTTCHGPDGVGYIGDTFPRLAGLDATYLITQLDNFRHGRRENTVMGPIAKALSEEETRAVTEYFSGLNVSGASRPFDPEVIEAGEVLATIGDWSDRKLPACGQCHGPDGGGIGLAFPALAAQHAGYIQGQIEAWQQGNRTNDPLGLMKAVADKLTAEEVGAVAGYYASLPPVRDRDETGTDVLVKTSLPEARPHTLPVPHAGEIEEQADVPKGDGPVFTPPPYHAYPDGPLGDAVRRGEQIFTHTNSDPVSGRYVGNDQTCDNCHMNAGRLADSAPMWAAWVSYPAYRGKNKRVNDIIMRVQGCFTYSMNAQDSEVGHPPASDSETLSDLMAYMYWLSTDAPTGNKKLAGRGYPKLEETSQGFSPERGLEVYLANCVVCHGYDGEGVVRDNITLFPPLWGDKAYNWGAGMHKINSAAGFIKANMPFSKGYSLTDQEAWDVAAYINSMPRPQDPRYNGNLEETAKKFHKSKYSLYEQVQKAGKGLTQ